MNDSNWLKQDLFYALISEETLFLTPFAIYSLCAHSSSDSRATAIAAQLILVFCGAMCIGDLIIFHFLAVSLKVSSDCFIMAYELTEIKKAGIGLIGFGIFFTFLGVVLFFDRGLLALGNIFWLAGVAILLGWRSTWTLFTNRANYKGTASFLLGLFFIFVRWPVVGIIFEIYGCVVLFGGFWSSVKVFLYHIPVVGWIIQFISPS